MRDRELILNTTPEESNMLVSKLSDWLSKISGHYDFTYRRIVKNSVHIIAQR